MHKTIFTHIPCGQTLPINNIHAVSVSMPSLQDVIDYEEQTPQILEKIKSAYPRFCYASIFETISFTFKRKIQNM